MNCDQEIEMAKKTLSFEESMQRLEEIVRLLERGDVPLEESLALFEEGSGLIARCSKLLDNAEQKVIKLKKGSDGTPVELPFDTEE
jgi:exodeoxyribonuclease VII small subunit